MMQQLMNWAPLLTILVSLGGLQLGLYLGLRADLRGLGSRVDGLGSRVDGLANSLSDVRERLARVETKLNIPASETHHK